MSDANRQNVFYFGGDQCRFPPTVAIDACPPFYFRLHCASGSTNSDLDPARRGGSLTHSLEAALMRGSPLPFTNHLDSRSRSITGEAKSPADRAIY